MTLTTIITGAFALVCAFVAAVYKEPKSYNDMMKPVLKWISLCCIFVGIGVFIGHYMVRDVALSFVAPTQLEEARKAIASSSYWGLWFQAAAVFTFALDIALYILAEQSAKWKTKE